MHIHNIWNISLTQELTKERKKEKERKRDRKKVLFGLPSVREKFSCCVARTITPGNRTSKKVERGFFYQNANNKHFGTLRMRMTLVKHLLTFINCLQIGSVNESRLKSPVRI